MGRNRGGMSKSSPVVNLSEDIFAVDMTIYLYVLLFILFTLAGLGPGELAALGSTFHTEWVVAMGLITVVPQLCEMVLEYGAVRAMREIVGGLFAASFFFIFQNKNMASSMREGAMTGL